MRGISMRRSCLHVFLYVCMYVSFFLQFCTNSALYIPQCLLVSVDYRKSWRGCVDNTEARVAPGSTVQCTVAGGQFIYVVLQLVQAKHVCCICERTAFYRAAVILINTKLCKNETCNRPNADSAIKSVILIIKCHLFKKCNKIIELHFYSTCYDWMTTVAGGQIMTMEYFRFLFI
jgi:hypothetical protein